MLVGSSAEAGPITVGVGDIKSSTTKSLTDLGFAVVANSSTPLDSITMTGGDATSVGYKDPLVLTSQITIDTDKLSQIADDDNLYLKVTLQYTIANTSYLPNMDSLEFYPTNYDYFSFEAHKSTDAHLSTKASPLFSFPLKAKTKMNLYDLASLDSTYPIYYTGHPTDYKVPITLRFTLSNVSSNFASSNATYKIVYGLTSQGEL